MQNKEDNSLQKSLKILARSSMIVFAGLFISKLLIYAHRVLVARTFGLEVYGLFSLAAVIVVWFTTLSALGFSEGMVRFFSLYEGKNKPEHSKYLFRYSLKIITFSSIISGIILYLASQIIAEGIFHSPGLGVYLKIFSIAIPLTVISYPFLTALRAFEKISAYTFAFNISQSFVKIAFLGILLFFIKNNVIVPWSYTVGTAAMFIASYLLCKYYLPSLFLKSNLRSSEFKKVSGPFVKYSIPLVFMSIISIIFYWFDSLSIGYFKGALEVGIYNVAVPIAGLLGITPEIFTQLFFPLITKAYGKKDMKYISELSKQVTKWILIINAPVFVLLFLFPGTAINLLFGAESLAAEQALRFLAIGSLISSVFLASNQLIAMAGKSKILFYDAVIMAVVNLILNILLVPKSNILFMNNVDGTIGAALSSLISITLLNVLFFLQAKKYTSLVPFRRKIVNVLVSLIPAVLILLLVKSFMAVTLVSVVLEILLFVCIYVLLLLVTKSLDRHDFFILSTIFRRLTGKNKSRV